MPQLSPEVAAVARHYDEEAFQYEFERLDIHSPVEYAITSRYLRRYVRPGCVIADVGVGAGHYAELLARAGCDIHLVDISARLLHATRERLASYGLAPRVAGIYVGSATDLSELRTEAVDVVLLLGPLYHLRESADRRQAIHEASRVLRAGGILFAAGINRLAYLRAAFDLHPEEIVGRKGFCEAVLREGKVDPTSCPPLGHAYLTTVEDFRGLFSGTFQEVATIGVESFSAPWLAKLGTLSSTAQDAWLDLIEESGRMPDALGHSDHFLYVGQKR